MKAIMGALSEQDTNPQDSVMTDVAVNEEKDTILNPIKDDQASESRASVAPGYSQSFWGSSAFFQDDDNGYRQITGGRIDAQILPDEELSARDVEGDSKGCFEKEFHVSLDKSHHPFQQERTDINLRSLAIKMGLKFGQT